MARPPRKAGRKPAAQARRRGIIETALAMSREGLSSGRSGNVSARTDVGMLITPTGLAYDALSDEDIVFVGNDGETLPGSRKPSSEWQMHLAVYQAKPDIGAIVHCHSMNATALACAGRPIPAFHYMVAVAGGADIRLARYATFGTKELAKAVTEALDGRRAALLAHHGQIACGKNLPAALDLAREVEALAAQYLCALQIGGCPILDDEEMARVLKRFKNYGQQ
jgi:L-fuculose-phosphate aldolase